MARGRVLKYEDLRGPGDRATPAGARESLIAASLLLPRARANRPISYSNLCKELAGQTEIKWVPVRVGALLGTLGSLLVEWSEAEDDDCPELQSFAVNSTTEVPGDGFYPFIEERFGLKVGSLKDATLAERQYWIDVVHREAHTFPHWDRVIAFVRKRAAMSAAAWAVLSAKGRVRSAKAPSADETIRRAFGGGPESDEHKELKALVRREPSRFKISTQLTPDPMGDGEFRLPSGDEIDVLFHDTSRYEVIEVKPRGVSELEHRKGLFQCIKYRSILAAMGRLRGKTWKIKAKLVCGGPVHEDIVREAGCLDIEVFEQVLKS
jgi:hypothetical protein